MDLRTFIARDCLVRKTVEIKGKRFGRWLVQRRGKRATTENEVFWRCVCDCGEIREVADRSLLRGRSKSCGCLHKEIVTKIARKGPGVSGFNSLFTAYRSRAEKRKIAFTFSREEFHLQTSLPCHYCEAPPAQRQVGSRSGMTKSGLENSVYIFNGLDRIDSFGGYTPENCVPCCGRCNEIKMASTTADLFAHLERMLAIYNSRLAP